MNKKTKRSSGKKKSTKKSPIRKRSAKRSSPKKRSAKKSSRRKRSAKKKKTIKKKGGSSNFDKLSLIPVAGLPNPSPATAPLPPVVSKEVREMQERIDLGMKQGTSPGATMRAFEMEKTLTEEEKAELSREKEKRAKKVLAKRAGRNQ